jgi:hypothetical protein
VAFAFSQARFEAIMEAVLWDVKTWAQQEFDGCALGDRRRNKRLVHYAMQAAARPDSGTPDQAEKWSDLQAVYRLFGCDDVTPQAILAPHCARTRESCRSGEVKLIVDDTTELNYTSHRSVQGLGSLGGGRTQRGFHVHSGLMLDAVTEEIDGLAGQEFFRRPLPGNKPGAKNTRRRDPERESAVWGKLIDRIGAPAPGVHWLHVCDRGADDYEVMLRALGQGCGFVIRAARLNRKVLTSAGEERSLEQAVHDWPVHDVREITVRGTDKQAGRKARCELRWGEIRLPRPAIINDWIRTHAPAEPLRLFVVELREIAPPRGAKPIRWVLYTTEAVTRLADANRVIRYYELRWTIEDFHKCYKTGCAVESRGYETVERLERVAAFSAVVAVRLLRLRTAAKQTPDRPADEVAPQSWIDLLKTIRRIPATKQLTIHEFVRALGGLGGHLGRKGDGEPGWITLWRGHEKLQLMLRGYHAAKKCV